MTPAAPRTAAALDALAALLSYPDERWRERAPREAQALREAWPRVAALAEPFLARALRSDGAALEETYAATFDWSPERSLDLGWHLYGEQYDRGAFLVRVRGLLRAAGVEEGADLPDHLRTVLRLLGRLPPEEAAPFCAQSVLPALERLRRGFTDPSNPYADLVAAAHEAVKGLAGATAPAAGAV